MNDLAVGRIARYLRHRLQLRQSDAGERADMSQGLVSLIERGRLDRISLRRLRRLFAAYDAEVVVSIRWRGADVDRLGDRAHARLTEVMARLLTDAGWVVWPEVSFSMRGERGSIDLLAWHPETRTLLVVEVKTEIGAVESTLRVHDVKCRLAATIARDRFGCEAAAVARLLVLPEHRTPRDHVARHGALFGRVYPLRTIAVRHWLKRPSGPMAGLMFLRDTTGSRGTRPPTARKR
ncbi:MAG: XRE family transcriptional regulator, partial [Chloroflexota bacterium]